MTKKQEWPREPAEAWKNDPINPAGKQAGKAIVFIRPGGGFGLGHVGWGYLDDRDHVPKGDNADTMVAQDKWLVGSVDNPHHTPISVASQQGYWQTEYTGEPLEFMRSRRYDSYKVIGVPNANTDKALEKADRVRRHPYELIGANCEDAVYRVLTAYGARLPTPRDVRDWEPNRWFKRIPGQALSVDDDTGLHSDVSAEWQEPAVIDRVLWWALPVAAGLLAGAVWIARLRFKNAGPTRRLLNS